MSVGECRIAITSPGTKIVLPAPPTSSVRYTLIYTLIYTLMVYTLIYTLTEDV